MQYASLNGGLDIQIMLIVGFRELGERLIDWDEDRRIMHRAGELKQEGVTKSPQPF